MPKDWNWIIEGDFNMIERPNDKSNNYGSAINDLERYNWNDLLMAIQIQDTFIHQRGPYVVMDQCASREGTTTHTTR